MNEFEREWGKHNQPLVEMGVHEDKWLYQEIDRLKLELEQARQLFVTEIEDARKEHKHYTELERQLAVATEALEEIITNGDYTAPEGMKLIARTALERIKE